MLGGRFARTVLGFLAISSIGGGTQAPILGPGFSASLDGRPFEPNSALAVLSNDGGGDSIRIVIDEVSATCADFDEARGRRISLGAFTPRGARPISANGAGATASRIGADGRVETQRIHRGSIRLPDAGRDLPIVPFDLVLALDGGFGHGDHVHGELRVTPCVFDAP